MVDFTKDKTWAATQTIENNADAGNIGKQASASFAGDVNTIEIAGFTQISSGASNIPVANDGSLITSHRGANETAQLFLVTQTDRLYYRRQRSGIWQAWQELYHTGNTKTLTFSDVIPDGSADAVNIGRLDLGLIDIAVDNTASSAVITFINPNGIVGSVNTSGTATSYNTSSDPRLKDFKDLPIDTVVDAEFNKLFSCFRTFNWKNDPDGDLVWGFDAHACVDAKLDIGNEGNGPRNLTLNDVYDITPAVFEEQEQQVVYKSGDKKGELRFNADNSPMMESVSIEITPEIENKVTPAGVDQSKAVPILLAKIEQLERRLVAAGL